MSFNFKNSGGWREGLSEEGMYSILNIRWKHPPPQSVEKKSEDS